ncbi:MAG: outer membrane beta-barrel protein, partial [Acidobacteriia bacterium]|nr:outer membrane beta-barrel protein [Terriglobia bacterium]
MRNLFLLAGAGLMAAGFLNAQEVPKFTFSIGGGFTQPVGATGSQLDTGWNVRGGAGVNFNSRVGANIDVAFDDFGINSNTLANFGVPGGSVHVFSATLDPIVHFNPHGHVDFYVTGGGGLFRWYQQFTQPAVGFVTGFNPFFGFYSAAVPTNQILASYSVNRPGIDIG